MKDWKKQTVHDLKRYRLLRASLETLPGRVALLRDAAQALRGSGLRVKPECLPLYLALILADSRVDERLLYQEAEELREMARSLHIAT